MQSSEGNIEKISATDEILFTLLYPLAVQDKKPNNVLDIILWIIYTFEFCAMSFFRSHIPLPAIFYKIIEYVQGGAFCFLDEIVFYILYGAAIFLVLLLVICLLVISKASIPSQSWLSTVFLYDYGSEEVVYLDVNPKIQAWGIEHIALFIVSLVMILIITSLNAMYNYFCAPTNPKGGGLFSREMGQWGVIMSTMDITQVVVNYVVSYYGMWRYLLPATYYLFIVFELYDWKSYFHIKGGIMMMITYSEGAIILLFGFIGLESSDSTISVVFQLIFLFLSMIGMAVILIIFYPRSYKSVWWLHPGGEMYVDPFNPVHLRPVREGDKTILKRAPRRPKFLGRIEVKRDIPIEEEEEEIEEALLDDRDQERETKEQLREMGLLEDPNKKVFNKSNMNLQHPWMVQTNVDVISPPNSPFPYAHIPKIKDPNQVEFTIRFIYQKIYRTKRRIHYVNEIYKAGLNRFNENADYYVRYGNYVYNFMKDPKRALNLVRTARQHHPELLNRFSIFVATRAWSTETESGDEYMSVISMQQLNENLPIAQEALKQARIGLREFWENLQRPQPDFS
ncbi:MAG: hypothetical protein EZS28_008750 [Streblomastix strix]|uniref:Uncharacterized protein n=1 Tax=Streblomastix strix TaxID=222440 RepID=A0A5J4WNE9_9EUKA|nr:MAG: hypothetical protein EZS28_008750 [Streblomastix strix]